MNKLFITVLAIVLGVTSAEQVCYFSEATCTGQATCQEFAPNSGNCGEAFPGSSAKINKAGDTFTLEVYPNANCAAPTSMSIDSSLNECTAVEIADMSLTIYVQFVNSVSSSSVSSSMSSSSSSSSGAPSTSASKSSGASTPVATGGSTTSMGTGEAADPAKVSNDSKSSSPVAYTTGLATIVALVGFVAAVIA